MFTPVRIDPPHSHSSGRIAEDTAATTPPSNLLAAAGLSPPHWTRQFQRQAEQLTDELLRRHEELGRQQQILAAQAANLAAEQRQWQLAWQQREEELAARAAAIEVRERELRELLRQVRQCVAQAQPATRRAA